MVYGRWIDESEDQFLVGDPAGFLGLAPVVVGLFSSFGANRSVAGRILLDLHSLI